MSTHLHVAPKLAVGTVIGQSAGITASPDKAVYFADNAPVGVFSVARGSTMQLSLPQGRQLAHIDAISHEGKIVVVGCSESGRLWYTVRRGGF